MTESAHPRHRKTIWLVILALSLLIGVGVTRYIQADKAAAAPKSAAPAVPVVTAVAREEDVPVYLSGIGNVTPLYSVTVKVRVDGQLDNVA